MAIQQTSKVTNKNATVQDRELDNVIRDVKALNEQPQPVPTTPNLQDVLDEGATAIAVDIILTNAGISTTYSGTGVSGNNFNINSSTGDAMFAGNVEANSYEDAEGNLRPISQTITITSAQILDIGNTPVDVAGLLSEQISVGEYYDIEKLILKNKFGTTPYSPEVLNFYGCFVSNIDSGFLANNDAGGIVTVVNAASQPPYDMGGGDIQPVQMAFTPSTGLSLSTYSGNNPTGGDGDVDVTVFYRIRTF